MEKISPPVRIFAILVILVGVAGMLALRTMGPSGDPVAIPAPVRKNATQPAASAAQPAKAAASVPPVATAKPAKPKPVVNPVVPASGFPVAVDRALREHAVVVVSLVVPGARVDALAAAEASAGAKVAGVGYLALNVLNEDVARALLTKLGALEDPSLLVIKRNGDVALQLNGFVDRDTVAQAAANFAA